MNFEFTNYQLRINGLYNKGVFEGRVMLILKKPRTEGLRET